MDARERRLETAKRVLQFLLDAEKDNNEEEYKIHLGQLKTMKKEYGIYYRLDHPTVFYSKWGAVKYVFERLDLKKFRRSLKS
jgi:hypothetical protein